MNNTHDMGWPFADPQQLPDPEEPEFEQDDDDRHEEQVEREYDTRHVEGLF